MPATCATASTSPFFEPPVRIRSTTSAATTAPAAVTTKAAVQPPRVGKGAYVYVGDTLALEGAEDGDYGAVSVADGVVTPKHFGWSVVKVGGEDMLITVPEPTIEVSANGTNVASSVTVPYTQGMEIKYVLKNYHHSKEKSCILRTDKEQHEKSDRRSQAPEGTDILFAVALDQLPDKRHQQEHRQIGRNRNKGEQARFAEIILEEVIEHRLRIHRTCNQ